MRKGERTKQEITHQAAALFNKKGFDGASISDIMAATGLEKGGIYRHFESKDDLALQAFDHAVKLVNSRYLQAIRQSHNAQDRLYAVVDTFAELEEEKPIGGGCPIMNTAIDTDDGHPGLRSRAQDALLTWHQMLTSVVDRGIERGEIRSDADPATFATHLISLMEGGLMMSRLMDDKQYLVQALTRLRARIAELSPSNS